MYHCELARLLNLGNDLCTAKQVAVQDKDDSAVAFQATGELRPILYRGNDQILKRSINASCLTQMPPVSLTA